MTDCVASYRVVSCRVSCRNVGASGPVSPAAKSLVRVATRTHTNCRGTPSAKCGSGPPPAAVHQPASHQSIALPDRFPVPPTNERTNQPWKPPSPPAVSYRSRRLPAWTCWLPPSPPSAGRAPVWPASRSRSLLFLLVALRCVALGCVLRARARPPAALTTQNVVGWSSNRRGSSPRTHGNHPADASLLPTGAPTAGLGRRPREPLRARPAGRKGSNHDHGVS